MTYVDRLEQLPTPARMFLAFLGVIAVIFAGLLGMTLFLVIFKIAIVGVC